MAKILGTILSIAGLVGIAFSLDKIKELIKINIPIPSAIFLYGGIALVVIGVILSMKSGKTKQAKEVPIYKGKNIVGYRRQ